MTRPPIGRLEQVDLRRCWEREDTEFTPWLAEGENIRVLGEALGLELEVHAQEANVGPFRADILCREMRTDAYVLIENQLERTDHTHLGQLMTYAAGLKAAYIVWIAQTITDEHRAALEWLNEITAEGFHFFAVEVEVWRIGDSAMAPRFNVVCKPNEWARSVTRAATGDSGPGADLLDIWGAYWNGFNGWMRVHGDPYPQVYAGRTSWRRLKMLSPGCSLNASIIVRERYAMVFVTLSGDLGHGRFEAMKARQGIIDEAVGQGTQWGPDPARSTWYLSYHLPFEPQDPSTWSTVHARMVEIARKAEAVVTRLLPEIDATLANRDGSAQPA
jgi:hypothetical protein